MNIFLISWAKWSKCCNCCRGQICNGHRCTEFDKSWFCRHCCQHESCCVHFPVHHQEYVKWTVMTVQILVGTSVGGGIQQLYNSAINVIVSNEYELWLLYFNFFSAIKSVLEAFGIYWTFYYQLCFYWSRQTVNKYENIVILDMLSEFFEGGYIFKISVDEEKDEFIRIDENVSVENKIYHKKDCFTYCLYFYVLVFAPLIGLELIWVSTFLNGDVSDMKLDKF